MKHRKAGIPLNGFRDEWLNSEGRTESPHFWYSVKAPLPNIDNVRSVRGWVWKLSFMEKSSQFLMSQPKKASPDVTL